MITFLPSTDFHAVAKCLDDKRLGAQRYEAWSILKWLRNPQDHPKLVKAGYCRMWEGYQDCLIRYTNAMLVEWAARGKNNNLLQPFDRERGLDRYDPLEPYEVPPWLGSETLHSYHRHALVAKFPEHYSKFGWSEDGSLYNGSYLWPVPQDETNDDRNKSNESGWILRWPKSMKLPAVPIPIKNGAETKTRILPKKKQRWISKSVKAKRSAPAAVQRSAHRIKRNKRMTLRSGRSV